MPINCDTALQEMVSDVPGEAENIDKSIEQIEAEQARLAEKDQAIRECITDKAKENMSAYLEGPKLAELQAIWPEVPGELGPLELVYGTIEPFVYGNIDYENGSIYWWGYWQQNFVTIPQPPPDPPLPPDPSYYCRYAYTPQVNWDDDQTILELGADYDFGNDYITHPVGIGAAYGLEPLVDMYDQAKSTLLGNKSKIEASVNVFKKYF